MATATYERKLLDPETTKRLTLDVPAELHKRIKVASAGMGEHMADVVRRILEKEFGTVSNPAGREQGAA